MEFRIAGDPLGGGRFERKGSTRKNIAWVAVPLITILGGAYLLTRDYSPKVNVSPQIVPQQASVPAYFSQYDANKNGLWDKQEIEYFASQTQWHLEFLAEQNHRKFKEVIEPMIERAVVPRGISSDDITNRFVRPAEYFDKNGDGRLDETEIEKYKADVEERVRMETGGLGLWVTHKVEEYNSKNKIR